ncbi:2007_t:CDS:2 [Rhizophagus irregularis]|nr:2007_t:CDS:2 [Rhizophagus irregularis]
MDEIEIETDKYMYEKEYVDDLENGNRTYGENITYVAISPDGSIVATFNPYGSSISITKLTTNEKAKIPFDINKFKKSNILGWSLAVSDIINTEYDTCLVAISCVTDKDINPKEIEEGGLRKLFKLFIKKQLSFWDSQLFLILLFISYIAISTFILTFVSDFDVKQFRLSCTSGEGMIKLIKFSFNNDNDNNKDNNYLIQHHGGVLTFLKNSKNSLKNRVTLICMNCVKIQKINIKLNKNISIPKEGSTYLLPENLFKKLESFEDSRCNWKYLLKSKFQEYLMVDTRGHQKINIEIYDVNNLQLVNVFYKHCEEDCLIEPGIFAISTDSRLFAYSYGNNTITLYLMESGLEVVSKKFDNIYKIKFLEFIEKDKKLFIIEEDKENNMKFYVWIISGCLNDYFSISKDDIGLSDSNILTPSKYDGHFNTLTKANGKVVFHNKFFEDQFKVVQEITLKRTTFGENDNATESTDEHEYKSCDLEPWNNSTKAIRGRFLNNDRKLLLIIGQNSIQLWKSKSINFVDFNNFRNFENSNLVYILISDKIKPETKTKFLIDDDMTTVITHACKSLAYLYKHTKRINSKEKHQNFVSGITNIIKDFIKRYPDNWKLMEIQYPLMSYLIYSRSFSLIKYILFDVNGQVTENLHKPQNKYVSYPYYNDLELCDDLELEDTYLKSANDLTLALKFCQDRDAVMLAYLLEYYSENSMTHIGWMINVTKILPDLSKLSNHDYYGNYMDLLLYKPCFGEMKYNFPIKKFRALSVCQDTLEVYVPLTNLLSTNTSDIFLYYKMREDISPNTYMVPLPNFTTHDTKVEGKIKKGIIPFLRKTLFPPGYKNLEDGNFSSFLRIKKNENAFFTIPSIEAAINSRWYQAMAYWIRPLGLYAIFLILFAIIPQFKPVVAVDTTGDTIILTIDTTTYSLEQIGIGIFYYIGIFLLGNASYSAIASSSSTYKLKDEDAEYNLTGPTQENPADTIWNAILSMYYLGTINLNNYSDNLPLKLFAFVANVVIVLVLFNMIIALMNDIFKKAKNDGNLGLLMYRKELIDDFERLDIPLNDLQLHDSPYICYLQDPDLMKKWMKKSQELRETKLYSWFKESVDKENITYDGVDITPWYELISSNENQDSISTPDHMTLWF